MAQYIHPAALSIPHR